MDENDLREWQTEDNVTMWIDVNTSELVVVVKGQGCDKQIRQKIEGCPYCGGKIVPRVNKVIFVLRNQRGEYLDEWEGRFDTTTDILDAWMFEDIGAAVSACKRQNNREAEKHGEARNVYEIVKLKLEEAI